MMAGFARWIGFFTMAAGVVGALLLCGGFFWFALQVPNEEVTLDHGADGIVVLTGAATRIPDAIELLAAERGKRLLITGVHRATSSREIARSRRFIRAISPAASTSTAPRSTPSATRWRSGAGRASTISIR